MAVTVEKTVVAAGHVPVPVPVDVDDVKLEVLMVVDVLLIVELVDVGDEVVLGWFASVLHRSRKMVRDEGSYLDEVLVVVVDVVVVVNGVEVLVLVLEELVDVVLVVVVVLVFVVVVVGGVEVEVEVDVDVVVLEGEEVDLIGIDLALTLPRRA